MMNRRGYSPILLAIFIAFILGFTLAILIAREIIPFPISICG